jgi:type IV secretory pathway VirB2 component (pilin)
MTMEIVLGELIDWLHRRFRNKVIKLIAIVVILITGFSLAFAEWSGQFAEWSREVND